MNFDEKAKTEILIDLLKEKYNDSRLMRDRSTKFAIWILGYFIIAIAWLLINQSGFTIFQKCALSTLLVIASVFIFIFLSAINRGFNINKEIIIKIETALGCYERGLYLKDKQLFPDEYRRIKKISRSGHFTTVYLLILIALLFTLISIWKKPLYKKVIGSQKNRSEYELLNTSENRGNNQK